MDNKFFCVLYITSETQFTHRLSHCLSKVLFCEGFILESFLKGIRGGEVWLQQREPHKRSMLIP